MMEKLVDGARPVEILGLARGDNGDLERRAPVLPLHFGFEWQGARFSGSVTREADRLVLNLGAALALVPFTGEDVKRRADLLTLVAATENDGSGPSLSVSTNGNIELKQQIALAPDMALTATALISETTSAVLSSAPVLDLLAESGLLDPAPRAAP